MMTAAYVVLLVLAGILTLIAAWVPGVACALAAFALAVRYEIRWFLDWSGLSGHAPPPRAIPANRRHIRHH